MTKAQVRKLETILAKLETLQNQVQNSAIRSRLGDGKSDLLRALSDANEQSR